LFVGDDWAEDHHDVEVQDASGRVLARARLPEGAVGISRLHELIGRLADAAADDAEDGEEPVVAVGIETDRGPWVQALVAAGYQVFGINPLQAARYRDRRSVSGAKSDVTDAHVLADMVRVDAHQLRTVAADSAQAAAVKVVTRTHKMLIWERTRHAQRLRHALRDFFPAALEAFEDLTAPEALELLAKAPDPGSAARLTSAQIAAAVRRANRRDVAGRTASIRAALRATHHLGQPGPVTAAYAVTVRALAGVLVAINGQIGVLQGEVESFFGGHPDVEIYLSQPGLGLILGARVLAEFGDAPARYASAKCRKNYAGTSPITRQSGKKKTVLARHVHNDRLVDALNAQAFAAVKASAGARGYYERLRLRGAGHNAALRQVANRLVGILHGCLKTRTLYDETTAWSHRMAVSAA
jgi:transposase